jgi:Fe-S cluster assembly iron-binding protein IscA
VLELTRSTIAALNDVSAMSDTAGVRIFTERDSKGEISLSVALVEFPAADDAVVERQGARVYLDPEAAAALADKVLDSYTNDGRIRLVVHQQ